MPTLLQNFANRIQPTIIPPSAGDLEEARIRRLTDLAKLRSLEQAPDIERQQLALAKAGLAEQQTYHKGALDLQGYEAGDTSEYRRHQIEQGSRGLDLTERGQNLDVESKRQAVRGGLLQSAFAYPDSAANPRIVAAADAAGFPEYATADKVATEHAKDVQAQQFLATAQALSDDPALLKAHLATMPKDPDIVRRIQGTSEYGTTPNVPGVTNYTPDSFRPGAGVAPPIAGVVNPVETSTARRLGQGTKAYLRSTALPGTFPYEGANILYQNRDRVVPAVKRFGREYAAGLGF